MARNKSDQEMIDAREEAREEDAYTYYPNDEWRARKKEWAESVIDHLKDIVYSMAKEGCTMGHIADFFGLSTSQLKEEFNEPFRMGRADLSMRIARRTVSVALKSNMPTGIIWAGKVFNGYSETMPVAEADTPSGVTFNVNISTKPKDGDTYDEEVTVEQEVSVDQADSTWAH